MLAKLRTKDIWDVIDWTVWISLLFPIIMVIAMAILESLWFLLLLPIPLMAFAGFFLKTGENKYCVRKFLFVDFLEDYLEMKQKYTELRKKHDMVISAKNTKVI